MPHSASRARRSAGAAQASVRIRRTIRAVKLLARDGRIPRPLRGAAAFGLLPIPGPAEEAVLLLVAALLWLFYREQLTEAWQRAG
jgi:hypothetical protein